MPFLGNIGKIRKNSPNRVRISQSGRFQVHYACRRAIYMHLMILPGRIPLNTVNITTEILLNQSTHTIPSREEILGIFRSAKAPLDLRALSKSLKVAEDAQTVLSRRLGAMERDGQLKSDPAGFYQLADQSGFIAGRVSSHRDGFGFVIPDEPGDDLFLSEKELQKVLHGDRVMAKITGTDRRGRPEGTIVEVVTRANTHIIGRLLNENGSWIVAPEDKRIGQDIVVSGPVGKAKSGQIVSVELTEQPMRFKQPVGKIVEVLGSLDDPGKIGRAHV